MQPVLANEAPPRQDAGGIPEGFKPIAVGGEFLEVNGPLYGCWRDDQLVVGLRIEPRHCNPARQCHGGMLASLADMTLPYAAMYDLGVPRRFTPTISLQVDYVAPVLVGCWLEGVGTVVRSTRKMLFAQGLMYVGTEVVMRASGIFKWGDLVEGHRDPADPFGLRGGRCRSNPRRRLGAVKAPAAA